MAAGKRASCQLDAMFGWISRGGEEHLGYIGAELGGYPLIQRHPRRLLVTRMNFIGLDIDKKTISYGRKDAAGEVLAEGTIPATGRAWMTGCERCFSRGGWPWKRPCSL